MDRMSASRDKNKFKESRSLYIILLYNSSLGFITNSVYSVSKGKHGCNTSLACVDW